MRDQKVAVSGPMVQEKTLEYPNGSPWVWLDQFKATDVEHNVVADEWAEASNQQPHHTHTPPHILTHTMMFALLEMRTFRVFNLSMMDWWTDGPID